MKHIALKKISIYLWELIYTQLVSTDDAADTDSTADFFLKRNGLLSKNVTPISAHIENFSLVENYFVLPSCSPIMFFVEHNASKPFRGAQSLHSGHSPPRI